MKLIILDVWCVGSLGFHLIIVSESNHVDESSWVKIAFSYFLNKLTLPKTENWEYAWYLKGLQEATEINLSRHKYVVWIQF